MSRNRVPVPALRRESLKVYLKKEYMLYLMLLPGIAYLIIFKYIPMGGIIIAFKDYKITSTIWNATWVGMDNFIRLFSTSGFQRALSNNISISLQKLILGFPAPLLLSLFINELRRTRMKKLVQTAVILPNFVSWVVVAGLMYAIFSPTTGALKEVAALFGYEGQMPNILMSKQYFQGYLVGTHIWKNAGMGTIVYLSAISGIDQNLYEAAAIDGAGRWMQMWHITLASMRSIIVTLLIFRTGDIMAAGFDQVYAMSNDSVIAVADIIDTYVFRMGLEQRKFSIATAAGVFQSSVSLILVLFTNWVARRIDPDGAVM